MGNSVEWSASRKLMCPKLIIYVILLSLIPVERALGFSRWKKIF